MLRCVVAQQLQQVVLLVANNNNNNEKRKADELQLMTTTTTKGAELLLLNLALAHNGRLKFGQLSSLALTTLTTTPLHRAQLKQLLVALPLVELRAFQVEAKVVRTKFHC